MRRSLAALALASLALFGVLYWIASRPDTDAHEAGPEAMRHEPTAPPAIEPPQLDSATDRAAPPETRVEIEAEPEAPPTEEPVTAVVDLAELRGRFLLPDGRPANDVALKLHGWQANSERVMKYGAPKDWPEIEARTDADGRFSIRFDPPLAFQFVLDAKLAGCAGVSWRWSSLPPRELTDVGEISLVRSGVVRGRIVNAKGDPVPGDWRVYGEAATNARVEGRDKTRVISATNPVTAEFVLEGLPPGSASLKADSRITNWIDGPSVEVRAGEEVVANIVYDGPDNSRRIVVVTFCRPLHVFTNPASGSIVLRAAGEERVAKKIPNSSQSWSFEDLEPGAYDIEIRDPLFEPWSQLGVRTGSSVNAHLRPNGAVQLSVVDSDGQAIEDYRLRVSFPQNGLNSGGMSFSFSPNEFELRGPGDPLPPDGLYRGMIPADVEMDSPFAGLEGIDTPLPKRKSPGEFVLLVDAPGRGIGETRVEALGVGETRLVTVRLASTATIAGRIVGIPAEQLEDVSVVIADASAGIDGAVEYVEGVSGSNYDEDFRAETHADAEGRFSFDGLAAGSYSVVARFHHDFIAVRDKVEVVGGQTREIELDPGVYGAIEGRILAHPDDLENAWVEALGAGFYDPFAGGWSTFDGEAPPRARVDSDGRFRIAPLSAATYELTLRLSKRPLPKDTKRWHGADGGTLLGSVVLPGPVVVTPVFDRTVQRLGAIHVAVQIDGERASGWTVSAKSVTNDPAHTRHATAEVASDGIARLTRLEPGSWRVGVVASDNTWSSWTSSPAELTPGGELEFSISASRHPGRILMLDEKTGAPRANEWLHWQHSDGSARLETDANGYVDLLLPAGSYTAIRNKSRAKVEWTATGPVPAEIRL